MVTQLEATGSRITGNIGGIKKQKYFTPDGREVWSVPNMHTYLDENKQEGIRDANLDRGWLLQLPSQLKPYCPHCDCWHDTPALVNKCGKARKALIAKYAKKGQKELGNDVEDRLTRMETMMEKMIETIGKMGGA